MRVAVESVLGALPAAGFDDERPVGGLVEAVGKDRARGGDAVIGQDPRDSGLAGTGFDGGHLGQPVGHAETGQRAAEAEQVGQLLFDARHHGVGPQFGAQLEHAGAVAGLAGGHRHASRGSRQTQADRVRIAVGRDDLTAPGQQVTGHIEAGRSSHSGHEDPAGTAAGGFGHGVTLRPARRGPAGHGPAAPSAPGGCGTRRG